MKLGIVGLGLMGSSLALAIKKYKSGVKILGNDKNRKHIEYALQNNVIDEKLKEPETRELDYLFIAVPVRSVPSVIKEYYDKIDRKKTIISDLGSTKLWITRQISENFSGLKFIGGHPIAGKEKSGPKSADSDLFSGSKYILTYSEKNQISEVEVENLKSLLCSFSCEVEIMTASRHDHLLAVTSHLPQILSSQLVNYLGTVEKEREAIEEFTGTGFKDTTRIAAGDVKMWVDIFFTNKNNISLALQGLIEELRRFQILLADEKENEIIDLMKKSKKRRVALEKVGQDEAKDTVG